MQLTFESKPEKKLVIKGAHRCSGDSCFKMVSANKLTCLDCLAKEAQVIMSQRGTDLSLEQCKVMLKAS